jgi:glycosyltransferase involved in cell wall biosynthesis
MTLSRFTVLICTHNRCKVLADALRSQAPVRPPAGCEVELIVVDNASTDRTAEVVQDFAKSVPFPVRYLHEQRLGHSFALNTGVGAATGDVIAFTDDDAFPAPHWLEALHESFVQRGADWAFGPTRPRWEGRAPAFFGPETRNLFAILDYGSEPFVVTSVDRPFIGVNHACRRAALDRVGRYREDLGGFGQKGCAGNDEDLFRRTLRAGLRIVYTPEAWVEHFIPEPRCRRAYYRSGTWRNSAGYCELLLNAPPEGPKLLGLPRYFFRKPLDHLARWLWDGLRGRRSSAFFHQLQTIRFAGLIWHAFLNRLTKRTGGAAARSHRGALRRVVGA